MANLDRLYARPGSSEWYTPMWVIEAARYTMGSIDLDPASSYIANKHIKAHVYHDVKDDGLSKFWSGNVWLNPPYGRKHIHLWIEKLVESPDINQWICITNNATETKWGQDLLAESGMVLFPSKRVKFWKPDERTHVPTQGQMIVASPSVNKVKFIEQFKGYGTFFDTIGDFAVTVSG